jgi:hypothetical protein
MFKYLNDKERWSKTQEPRVGPSVSEDVVAKRKIPSRVWNLTLAVQYSSGHFTD